jgi:hypothetical protein
MKIIENFNLTSILSSIHFNLNLDFLNKQEYFQRKGSEAREEVFKLQPLVSLNLNLELLLAATNQPCISLNGILYKIPL